MRWAEGLRGAQLDCAIKGQGATAGRAVCA